MEISALVVGGIAAGQIRSVPEKYTTFQITQMPPARVTPCNHYPSSDNLPVETYHLHEINTHRGKFYFLHRDSCATPHSILKELTEFYHLNQD